MSLWVPRPSDIVTLQATGMGDMGSVTDRVSVARFALDVDRYVLCSVKQIYAGGTGSATVTLKVDHRIDTGDYDFGLIDWETMGTSGTVWDFTRMTADELYLWTFLRNDVLVFEWTNPDPAVMQWSLEVSLADATKQ